MKKAVLISLVAVLLSACVTKKETYLIIVDQDQTQVKPICINRFEKQFNQADSVFMSKLREASRQAAISANKQLKLK